MEENMNSLEHKKIDLFPMNVEIKDCDETDPNSFEAYEKALDEISDTLLDFDIHFCGMYSLNKDCFDSLFYDYGTGFIFKVSNVDVQLYANNNSIAIHGYPPNSEQQKIIDGYLLNDYYDDYDDDDIDDYDDNDIDTYYNDEALDALDSFTPEYTFVDVDEYDNLVYC